MTKFLRAGTKRFKRLGRKKMQKWRRARGRHSKIREKRKNRQAKVEIGYRKKKSERYKIMGKLPVFIKNLKDVSKVKKKDIVIISKIGRKKRSIIEEKIKEIGGILIK